MGVLKENLTIEDFISYSRGDNKIKLSKEQEEAVKESSRKVEEIKKPTYGINTGFGALCDKIIKKEDIKQLQTNLIKSHSCGIGEPLTKEETKGSMLLLINSLAKGYSGIRLETLETLIEMYNKEVLPIIPEKGSLGASGDLIPLAHLALVLIGEGEALYEGRKMSGKQAMEKAGIKPVMLIAKEGLALINGTHVATAISALNIYHALQTSKTADIAAAMSFEALKGKSESLDSRIHELKPYEGQKDTADVLRKLIEGSELVDSHKKSKVQDPYSLRCIPQIHGPVKDELNHAKKVIETEMNSVTDNPLFFEEECLSGGNFHAQYVAIVMDNLASTINTLASVSERRIERLLNTQHSGLPAFLTKKDGLNSGLMITQYLSAALISINRILAYPASNTSIPVSANQEDYVSMAMTSALKAKEIIKNIDYVLAVELLCAAQALEFSDKNLGKGTQKAYEVIRRFVLPLKEDRILHHDIERVYGLARDGLIQKEVEKELHEIRVKETNVKATEGYFKMLDDIVEKLNEKVGEQGKVYWKTGQDVYDIKCHNGLYYDIKQKAGILKSRRLTRFHGCYAHTHPSSECSSIPIKVSCEVKSPEVLETILHTISQYAKKYKIDSDNINITKAF